MSESNVSLVKLTALLIAVCGFSVMYNDRAVAQPSEAEGMVGYSTVENAGRLRMIAALADKQYLQYQFRIDFQSSKEPLLQSVEDFDRTLNLLRQGSAIAGVAPPPNDAIRQSLDEVAAFWKDLRRVYTYNSIQVRRAKDLIQAPERLADPYLVTFVDRLSAKLIAAADGLVELYEKECTAGGAACDSNLGLAARQRALIETIATDVMFVALGIDEESHQSALRDSRDEFESTLNTLSNSSSGQRSAVADILDSIENYWRQLDNIVEMALSGDADSIDIGYMVRILDRLKEDLDSTVSLLASAAP